VLSLPGVIARRVYLSYPFSKKYSISSINDEVAWSLMPALLLQYLMLTLVGSKYLMLKLVGSKCFYAINFQVLGTLIAGGSNGASTEIAFENIRDNFDHIALYNFSLWLIAATVGFLARRLIILLLSSISAGSSCTSAMSGTTFSLVASGIFGRMSISTLYRSMPWFTTVRGRLSTRALSIVTNWRPRESSTMFASKRLSAGWDWMRVLR
jgi:hypothetical protein